VIFDHSCQSDVGEGENDASDNIVLSLGTCTRADVALGSAHYWSKSLLGEVGSACRPDLGERHLVSLDVAKVGFRNLYRGAIGDGRDYPRGACHTASQRVPPDDDHHLSQPVPAELRHRRFPANDSTFIVIATVGAQQPAPGGYPLYVENILGGTNELKVTIGIGTEEFDAAHLTVGGTYVFFYGVDSTDKAECIVGGVRGVFAYDPTTQVVTRLDQDPTSQIPRTQTLTQLQDAINASENADAGKPIANIPPLCESSATGL
jgi:hypothetical protein